MYNDDIIQRIGDFNESVINHDRSDHLEISIGTSHGTEVPETLD
jgi:hypothetical protein